MKSRRNFKVVIKRICDTAQLYKANMVGKTFLILYEGKRIEILFKTENFLHLCGVESSLSAKDFYKKALKYELNEAEIHFSNKHPYNLADIKTKCLSEALAMLQKDTLMITELITKTRKYKMGTTDLKAVVCFDVQTNIAGEKINDILIPYSLRVEEIANNRCNEMFEVDYVLVKATGKRMYSEIIYGNPSELGKYLEDRNIECEDIANSES